MFVIIPGFNEMFTRMTIRIKTITKKSLSPIENPDIIMCSMII